MANQSELFIYLNDFTDSDNEASAEAWARLMGRDSTVKGIYIAEPRWVNLGYYMSSNDIERCKGLIRKLQPPLAGCDAPLTTVLAGRLTQDMVISRQVDGRPLNEDERDLLIRCVKPANGSKDEAITHARLVTMDFLTTMRTRCSEFEAYIDEDCLEKLQSPINLKAHYHDELVARSVSELNDFRDIMKDPTNEESQIDIRKTKLRDWYIKAIERKKQEFGGRFPFEKLDYNHIISEIRKHEHTTFFGGASLTLLRELLEKEPELCGKVRYFQQGGTFDPKLNILGNPYNFALNTDAADYVFRHHDKLERLTLIPTDAARKLEWTAQGLAKLSPAVGVRSLAFHGLHDPWELISPEEYDGASHSTQELLAWRAEWTSHPRYTDPCKGYKAVMADLTAFLVAFTDVFKYFRTGSGSLKQTLIKVAIKRATSDRNQMILEEDQTSSIVCLMFTPWLEAQNALVVEDALELVEKALRPQHQLSAQQQGRRFDFK